MKKYWADSGVLLERVKWSKVPLVVASVALMILPALALARGPIVSASVDWASVLWSMIVF